MENGNFTFACPHCGQHLEAEPDMVGMEFDCPGCGKMLAVPSAPPPVITVIKDVEPAAQPPVITVVTQPPVITVVKGRRDFFEKNKKWLVPVAVGLAAVLLVAGVVAARSRSGRRHPSGRAVPSARTERPSSSRHSPSQTFSGPRKFVKEHIAKNDNCRIVAITKTNGDVVVCGDNNWAASGCPKGLTDALREIDHKGERITDVCLTEGGRYIVLFGHNSARWLGIPTDMERSLRRYNANGEKIYSATFNDAGDWITVSDEHYTCSATWLKAWLAGGAEKYGILRAAAVSTDAAVACFDGGYLFFGNVPEDLKDALREADFDVRIIKVAGSAWFFASEYGYSYRASM